MIEGQVREFLAARSDYTEHHVREIARHCADENIPFCGTCKDWHFPDEEHSAGGGP